MSAVTDSRLDLLLQSATSRLLASMARAFDQSETQLGSLAIAATRNAERQAFLDASHDLLRRGDEVRQVFAKELSMQIAQALQPHNPQAGVYADTDWSALRLVDEAEVEQSVSAGRLSRDLESQCEGELRELHAYFATLQDGTPEDQIFPLRPAIVGKALLKAVMRASDLPAAQHCLADVLSIQAGGALRDCYRHLLADCQQMGISRAPLVVKRTANTTSNGELGHPIGDDQQPSNSRGAPLGRAAETTSSTPARQASSERVMSQLGQMFGMPTPTPMPASPSSTSAATLPMPTQASHGSLSAAGQASGVSAVSSNHDMVALMRHLQRLPDLVRPTPQAASSAPEVASFTSPLVNVIRVHREALVEASGGTALDQMVIDIVAALFDQVLADPDVPPQMARQISRLQLPVLRVALRDQSFFHARKHPVRRLINRMGSIAALFDDLAQGAGQKCIEVITTLVNEIVEGDFDQIELYNDKLGALEAFIEAQREQDTRDQAEVTALLSDKEADLRVQQRYMQMVGRELSELDVPEVVRHFLTQVWTQVQVNASARHGADSPEAMRFKQAAHRLVMSVQPQGHPSLRQSFLRHLPGLMRDLHDGLGSISWPAASTQAFLESLLPLHAQAMKAPPAHQLTLRLLEDRLRHVERICIPSRAEAANDALPQGGSAMVDISLDAPLTPQEAARVGWLSQAAVNHDSASLDIDLSAGEDPALCQAEVDILLDSPAPPAAGPSLVNYIQSGAAYRMMLKGHWRKVRLTWVSEGRTFFLFTQGHQGAKQTISLTARTLQQMCASGRFKAFEQAQLLERATIRARRQLAALSSGQKQVAA